MKRILLGALALAAVAVAGCQQRDQVSDARQDLAETRAEVNKDVAQEQQKAAEDVAEARQDGQEKIADKRENLAEAQQDQAKEYEKERADTNGAFNTATGRVTKFDKDSLKLKTDAGNDLDLDFADNHKSFHNIHEGDQVRATYKVLGDDKVVESLEVINPAMKK